MFSQHFLKHFSCLTALNMESREKFLRKKGRSSLCVLCFHLEMRASLSVLFLAQHSSLLVRWEPPEDRAAHFISVAPASITVPQS